MSARTYVITLSSGGKVVGSPKDVDRGCAPVVIGRSQTCGIQTPADDFSVSSKHARLFWQGRSLYLEDTGSRNGVYADGRRIEKPVKVTPGGLYMIGNCQLSVSLPGRDKSGKKSRYHKLEFLTGDRERDIVEIKPKSADGFWIGCDPGCDICIPDMIVSRKHAKISVRSNGDCWIVDEGSRNGTYVNGEKLPAGKERLLKDGNKISIAYFDIRFLDRDVAHTHTYLWAKMGVLLITGVVLTALYFGWKYNPSRLTPEDYMTMAEEAAGEERFDDAISYLDEAEMAPNSGSMKEPIVALRGQVKQWKGTFEKWNEIREAFSEGSLRDARVGLSTLLEEAYAWTWNNTSALEMRKDAEFAQGLIRMCVEASNASDLAEKDISAALSLSGHIEKIDSYMRENAAALKKRAYLGKAVGLLERYRGKFVVIRDGIAKIDAALENISGDNPDFVGVVSSLDKVAKAEGLSRGVRNYATSLVPVSKKFIETQKFLEREKIMVTDLDFASVLKQKDALPLPDKDSCARLAKFSAARATFQSRHAAYLREVSVLGPMVRNLESAGIHNGEKGRILTFATDAAMWRKALEFDCFSGKFPLASRVDPTSTYDKLVGIEYTYGNLRELPKPPGRQTAVLMNFVPMCQTAKAAFEQVHTFLLFMNRPEGNEFRTGKLGHLYALGAQILSDREKLIAELKEQSKKASSDRARILAGYYAAYFADEPSYAELTALATAFRNLQNAMNTLNERYEAESDPEKRISIRQEILDKGIPGMESVRKRWVEVGPE